MDIQRRLCVLILFGIGSGFVGCQSPGGGLAFWKSPAERSSLASSPDVGKQKYEGLAKEFPSAMPRTGAAPTNGLGGAKPAESGNIVTSTWKKATGAVAGVFTRKPTVGESADPTSLSNKPKKVGAEVYLGAARLLESQGKLDEAQGQYEKALAAAPSDLNSLVGLARLNDRRGNGPKAIELYQRAAKAHPKSALVQNDLGLCLGRQRQYEPALAALGKAIELAPADAKYRNNVATVLVEMGRPDDAFRHLAATAPPPVAHYNLGFLLTQRGQRELATRHFQQALLLDANMAPAREMLAQLGAPPPGAVVPAESRIAARPVSTPVSANPLPVHTGTAPVTGQFQPVQQPAIETPPAGGPYPVRGTSYTIDDDGPAQEPAGDKAVEESAEESPVAEEPAVIEPAVILPKLIKAKPLPIQTPAVRSSYYEGVAEDEAAAIKMQPSVEQ